MTICAHEDYEPINKVGMMWNMVEPESFGALTFCKNGEVLEETKMISKLCFEQRISKL